MRKRKKWYKHRSKGLYNEKLGGRCVTLKVNWWQGVPAPDARLKEKMKT